MKALWTALRELLPLLPSNATRLLVAYSVSSSILSFLDVAALGLLAMTLSPMVQGDPVDLPLIGPVGESRYVWIILAVCGLIGLKGVLQLGLQWLVTRRLADYELIIGDRLFDAYIHAPWTERLKRNSAELVRLADVGIANTTTGLLLPAAQLPTEVVTFTSVLLVLLVAEPVTALIALVYLSLIALLMYLVISKRAVVAGRVSRDYSFRVARLMTEMVAALKEITLRDKGGAVADVVRHHRRFTTRSRANLQFLNAVPKFVTETGLIGGFALVGGAAYATGGPSAAFSAVALFAVAGFRMVPSVNRFQGIITQTSATLPHANAVIRDIKDAERYRAHAEQLGTEPLEREPRRLTLRNVTFTYPGADAAAVTGVDLDVPMGSSLALVGASGAGKSTLVDLILGLLLPSRGSITVDGKPLRDVLAAWRSRVGYVPQDVSLFDASVAQNVALTWEDDFDEVRVREALERAQLLDVVEARPGGIHARVGERGMALSGGQRQRLGIARALYTDPLVLVLDEATSALDTVTEQRVAAAIAELHGDVTVISVAHRLSTVRHSDQVCFMRGGTIVSRGTFEELVAAEPDFAAQAHLAGLA